MALSFERFYHANRRISIWLVLLGLLWLLSDFFALLLLTFVIAFAALSLTRLLQRYIAMPYQLSLTTVYAALLLGLALFVIVVVPTTVREANRFVGNIDQIEQEMADVKSDFFDRYPAWQRPFIGFLRSYLDDPALVRIDQSLAEQAQQLGIADYHNDRDPNVSALSTAQKIAISNYHNFEEQLLLNSLINELKTRLRDHLPMLARLLYQATVTLLLALLFSFLILVDLVRLQRQLGALQHSKLKDFYNEAAQPMLRFALIVGRTIQVQAVIATINTLLIITGLWLIGVPSLTMLALVVFLCSFIPVLGVFLSTVPIVLVAFNNAGPLLAAAAVGLIIVINFIEAFLLNPLVYGQRMQLNPVMVLVILFVGHHLFGIWGMVLGVPVTLYVFQDVFGFKPEPPALSPAPQQRPTLLDGDAPGHHG